MEWNYEPYCCEVCLKANKITEGHKCCVEPSKYIYYKEAVEKEEREAIERQWYEEEGGE